MPRFFTSYPYTTLAEGWRSARAGGLAATRHVHRVPPAVAQEYGTGVLGAAGASCVLHEPGIRAGRQKRRHEQETQEVRQGRRYHLVGSTFNRVTFEASGRSLYSRYQDRRRILEFTPPKPELTPLPAEISCTPVFETFFIHRQQKRAPDSPKIHSDSHLTRSLRLYPFEVGLH